MRDRVQLYIPRHGQLGGELYNFYKKCPMSMFFVFLIFYCFDSYIYKRQLIEVCKNDILDLDDLSLICIEH